MGVRRYQVFIVVSLNKCIFQRISNSVATTPSRDHKAMTDTCVMCRAETHSATQPRVNNNTGTRRSSCWLIDRYQAHTHVTEHLDHELSISFLRGLNTQQMCEVATAVPVPHVGHLPVCPEITGGDVSLRLCHLLWAWPGS